LVLPQKFVQKVNKNPYHHAINSYFSDVDITVDGNFGYTAVAWILEPLFTSLGIGDMDFDISIHTLAWNHNPPSIF
jgi:hypothetical protein